MSDGNGTDWPRLLQEVLAETDLQSLRKKADALEAALYFRSQELQKNPGVPGEQEAMKRASQTLLCLRVERLGYPKEPLPFKHPQE
jgi:hypothetical protein